MNKNQTNKTNPILFFFQNSCHNRYRSSDYKGVDVVVLVRIVITASSPLTHAHMYKDKCLYSEGICSQTLRFRKHQHLQYSRLTYITNNIPPLDLLIICSHWLHIHYFSFTKTVGTKIKSLEDTHVLLSVYNHACLS